MGLNVNTELHKSIGFQLLRVVFGFYLIVTIIVTVTQLYYEYSNAENSVITELYNVGNSFEDGLQTALWSLDTQTMQSILVGINKIRIITGVKLTNPDGKIEASDGVFSEDENNKKVNGVVEHNLIKVNEISIQLDGEEKNSMSIPSQFIT